METVPAHARHIGSHRDGERVPVVHNADKRIRQRSCIPFSILHFAFYILQVIAVDETTALVEYRLKRNWHVRLAGEEHILPGHGDGPLVRFPIPDAAGGVAGRDEGPIRLRRHAESRLKRRINHLGIPHVILEATIGKDDVRQIGRVDGRPVIRRATQPPRFDDRRTRLEGTGLLGLFDHRHRNTVLHTATRIEELNLHQHAGTALVQLVGDLHERSAANLFQNATVDLTHLRTSLYCLPLW